MPEPIPAKNSATSSVPADGANAAAMRPPPPIERAGSERDPRAVPVDDDACGKQREPGAQKARHEDGTESSEAQIEFLLQLGPDRRESELHERYRRLCRDGTGENRARRRHYESERRTAFTTAE